MSGLHSLTLWEEKNMVREITREQAKDLFRDILKSGGVDLEEIISNSVSAQIDPVVARLEEQATQHMATITRGYERPVEVDKGKVVGGMIRMLAMAKGDQDKAVEYGKKVYELDDHPVVKALMAGDATAGGFLVAPEFSAEVIELLRPMSVVRSMNPIVMPMDTGSISIPKLTGGATANYVGESANIPSSQQTTGMLDLTWKKLAALVPISNDLLRFTTTSPSADAVVRDDVVMSLAQREDLAFIRGDGLSGTPKGLRNWAPAANVLTVNPTINLANVTEDLGLLVLQLENADVRMLRPGWLFAPRTKNALMNVRDGNGNFAFRPEMLLGTLNGLPFKTTTQIPIDLVVTGATGESENYVVDFADVVIGESSEIIVDASANAAYFDTPSGAVVSSFSRDETVIRAIARHDFGMRHDASVAVHSDVDWETI
jgi:HK97 family phage major capsid protein